MLSIKLFKIVLICYFVKVRSFDDLEDYLTSLSEVNYSLIYCYIVIMKLIYFSFVKDKKIDSTEVIEQDEEVEYDDFTDLPEQDTADEDFHYENNVKYDSKENEKVDHNNTEQETVKNFIISIVFENYLQDINYLFQYRIKMKYLQLK